MLPEASAPDCPALLWLLGALEVSGALVDGLVLCAAIHALQDNKVNVSKIVFVIVEHSSFLGIDDDVDGSLEGKSPASLIAVRSLLYSPAQCAAPLLDPAADKVTHLPRPVAHLG